MNPESDVRVVLSELRAAPVKVIALGDEHALRREAAMKSRKSVFDKFENESAEMREYLKYLRQDVLLGRTVLLILLVLVLWKVR